MLQCMMNAVTCKLDNFGLKVWLLVIPMLDHKSTLIIATKHQQLYMLKLASIQCTGCINMVALMPVH